MLKINEKIGEYTIVFPIKQGSYADTYRVRGNDGKLRFLKLINRVKLHPSQLDSNNHVLEIEISKMLKHPNICLFHDEGSTVLNGQPHTYFVTEFVSGETVAQRITREQRCSVYDAKQIVLTTLNILKYLHGMDTPIIHNEVTIQNLMLDLSGTLEDLKLIDFGHAVFLGQVGARPIGGDWNPFYIAPERFNGVSCVQSDLYAVGAMLYHLLFGQAPWYIDLSRFDTEHQVEAIMAERRKPLKMLNLNLYGLDNQLLNTIVKATSQDIDQRFQTAAEFIKAVTGETILSNGIPNSHVQELKPEKKMRELKPRGNGFADVAGMDDLKKQLQNDIIKVLKNPEKAKKFGIHIPNGILFYGPPGCGKTFFAEKLAEEIGCHYMYVKCSDVASPYIHGGQGKIAKLFEEARSNAPTLLVLDEVEAMIRDRSAQTTPSEAGEVNEFLAQLNNCGEDGVTVVGATNLPKLIDKAALRSGRLERHYEIPQPDFETRKKLFEISLAKRATAPDIDYEKLAALTENYSCADINEIINNAARTAFSNDCDFITTDMLVNACNRQSNHLTKEEIDKRISGFDPNRWND